MSAADVRRMPPSAVVLDLVLAYATTMGRVGTALIAPATFREGDRDATLVLTTRNHQGTYVTYNVPVHFSGVEDVDAPRFLLYRLGPGVWKLAPSVKETNLHAYVTVTDVPDPAPWEK